MSIFTPIPTNSEITHQTATKFLHSSEIWFPWISGTGWRTIKSSNSKIERWGWSGGGKAGLFCDTSIKVKPSDQISDCTA